MKILWHSTAPFGPSSYSVLTARTVPGIVRQGHDVSISTWYGLQGAPQKWPIRKDKGTPGDIGAYVTVFPSWNANTYGVDTLLATYQMVRAEVLITCMDVWVLPANLTGQTKFCPWLPIDHDPAPQGVVDSCQPAIYPMVYSKWGTEVLEKAGVKAHYVPCSADASVYVPGDRKAAKQGLGIPSQCDFLVTMVAANKDPGDRKGFAEGMAGFAKFLQSHPNAYLLLHTYWDGPINIGHLAERLGITERVIRPEGLPYIYGMYGDDYMVRLFQASDVLLNPAKSEGFGLPVLEAQMCGTPVVATDFSTHRELAPHGYFVQGQPCWSYGADSWRLAASIDSVADALAQAYRERDNATLRAQVREDTIGYDTETVHQEYWVPALQAIERLVGTTGGMKLVRF